MVKTYSNKVEVMRMSEECISCKKKLILKKREPYKDFFMCSNEMCPIVSIIITTTEKFPKEKLQEG